MPETRVLVVDDNPLGRELASEVLADAGYAVDLATGADEAVAAWRLAPHDVVVLDWHLKGDTGMTVLAAIRAVPDAPTRVLVVTADVRSELRDAALRGGADGVLTKPYRPVALKQAVDELRSR